MADKEIKFKVIAETDTNDLDSLENQISNMDNSTVKVSADDSEITSLEEEIDNLKGIIEEEKAYGFDTTESEEELSQLETKLDEAKAKAEEGATLNINGDTEAIDSITSSLEGLNDLSVGDVLQQYGSGAEDMAQQMNEANISVGQLATNTGIAEPQLISMINTMTSADFPQEDALAYVNALNQMGVSSEHLSDSAASMDIIGDATGMSAQQVVSLTQSLRGLGVSADNLPSSFNAIAYAQANVNGGAETLQTVLKRQAGTLNEYGVNIDQVVIMMQALSQQGVQGMKMGSALSKVLKDNNGDLSAVEQQLGLTAGTLTNASNVTGQYQGKLEDLASEEGEHKTLIDQLGALYDKLTLSIGGVVSPIMSLVGLGGQVAGFGMELNGVWELTQKLRKVKGFNTLKQGLINLGSSAKNAGIQMLTLAKNTLLAGVNALKSVAMWVAQKAALVASTVASYAQAVATKVVALAQQFLNFVMSMNPIMLVVIAIIALIAVLIYLYYNVDSVRQVIDNLGASIIATAQWIYNGFISIANIIGSALSSAWNSITSFIGNMVNSFITGASNAVNGFMNWIRQLPGMLAGELQKMLEMASNFIMEIANKLTGGAAGMVVGWITGSGEHSPGYMYDAFTGELEAMEKAPKEYDIAGSMQSVGSKLVGNFNPNFETSNASLNEGFGVGGNNIIINIENVDNEERIRQIAQAVEEALKFDNIKAGRSV